MRRVVLLLAAVLVSSTLALSQAPSSKPISAFDQQLIDQQKQLLQAEQTKDSSAVEHAIADDFQGIATNGDFYDRSEAVDAAKTGTPKETRAYDFHVVKPRCGFHDPDYFARLIRRKFNAAPGQIRRGG